MTAALRVGLVACGLAGACLVVAGPPPGTVLWSYDTASFVLSSPALGSDGTIYLVTATGLSAITNNGILASNKWTFAAARPTAGTAAIGSSGTIYCGSADGNLYAINSDGRLKWSYPLQANRGSPAIGADEAIYFAAGGYLYAVGSDGHLKWKSSGGDSGPSPAIDLNGTIYQIGNTGRQLYAFNPDGTQKWVRPVLGPASDSPAIGVDGTIYVSAALLYAFAPDGTVVWSGSTNNVTGHSPAAAPDGTLYIKDFNYNMLDAISPAGQLLWRKFYDSPRSVTTVPAIDVTGTAYYCYSNTLAAVTPQGSLRWTFTASPPYASPATASPLIGEDGTLYAVFGTRLYALAGTNHLANSAWPMFRQNPRHTGRLERPTRRSTR
jgi:outer membrane protein assembly factor BamB